MSSLIVLNDCATIQLKTGGNTLIDTARFVELSQWKWSGTQGQSGIWYARRGPGIRMHRQIMESVHGPLTIGTKIDHCDRDGRNNTLANLRQATHSENMANAKKHQSHGVSSQYKGVRWSTKSQKWVARIRVNGQRYHLGHFLSETDAAAAYNGAAARFYGAFARINDI